MLVDAAGSVAIRFVMPIERDNPYNAGIVIDGEYCAPRGVAEAKTVRTGVSEIAALFFVPLRVGLEILDHRRDRRIEVVAVDPVTANCFHDACVKLNAVNAAALLLNIDDLAGRRLRQRRRVALERRQIRLREQRHDERAPRHPPLLRRRHAR